MSGKTKLTRHQCRELIFKLLFAKEFHKEADPKEYYDSYIEITEEPTAEYVENGEIGAAFASAGSNDGRNHCEQSEQHS